jgi:hypothetical protein
MSESFRLIFIRFGAFYSCYAIEIAGAVPTFKNPLKSITWFLCGQQPTANATKYVPVLLDV